MPKPFGHLSTHEQGLFKELGRQPDARDLPRILADAAEDGAAPDRASLLRAQSHLAACEVLYGRTLTNDECAQVLTAPSADTARLISQLLGGPERPALPDLRTPAGIRRQYDLQRALLASLNLPVGVDRFKEIAQRLSSPALCAQIEGGRTLLLLSPRIPLAQAIAAFEQGLRRNVHLLPGGRLHKQPVSESRRYQQEGLLYAPANFQAAGGGLTEQQWLAQKKMDVLLLDPSQNVPENRHLSAAQALRERRAGEVFLAPQSYIQLFLSLLELCGEVLDRDTFTLLAGACFASSRCVPRGRWGLWVLQAVLSWERPDDYVQGAGARIAGEVA